MNGMGAVQFSRAMTMAITLIAGVSVALAAQSGPGPVGTEGAQAQRGVAITANASNVLAEFSVMPVDQVSIYRNDKTYKVQEGEWVKEDYSGLTDYIALVCVRKSEKGGLSIGVPSISGVKRVDARLKAQFKGGRLFTIGMASSGFDRLYAVNDLKGKTTGHLGMGDGTLVLIWFMPNVPGNYEVSGLSGKSVVSIRIE